MRQSRCIVRVVSAALIVLSVGCATPGVEVGPAQKQSGGSPSANAVELQGMWRGSFGQIASVGDSGRIHGDIVCQISGDGTYKTTWITGMVAGSTRGGRLEMSGTVAARGNLVLFTDSSSGSRMSLKRDGDTMYAVVIDPATKRVQVALDLHKVREGQ